MPLFIFSALLHCDSELEDCIEDVGVRAAPWRPFSDVRALSKNLTSHGYRQDSFAN